MQSGDRVPHCNNMPPHRAKCNPEQPFSYAIIA
jgi:hypothetical protein